jgi:hypothetical protein
LNEVKNPIRTLKTVGPAALFTACVMYLLANVAYLAVVPLEDVKSSKELIAALFFERVFGVGFGNVFLPLAVALSAVGNVMVVTFSLVSRARPTIRYSDLINRLVSTRKSQGKVFYHMRAFLLLISRSALLWEV